MLKQYVNELKNYSFYQKIELGSYVDAKEENRWKVAQVKDITKYGLRTTIELKFDGYSSKFNQHFDLPSSHKLAPFRRYSMPFTGPSSSYTYMTEIKRQQPPRSMDQYIKSFPKLQNLEKLKPEYINQFLRGELFIYVDYLLTKKYETQKELQDIYLFIEIYVRELAKLLKISVQFLAEIQKENISDPNLIYVHPKIAILFSNTEFLFNCNSLISKQEKRGDFVKVYDRELSKTQGEVQNKFKEMLQKGNIANNCEKLLKFTGLNNRGLPWSIKKEALIFLTNLIPNYPFPSISDHKEMIEMLDYMNYFATKGIFTREEADKKSVEIVIGMIVGGNFEGRLRGLNQIKRIIQYPHQRKEKIIEELESKKVINFLIDNNNFNGELFKRSIPIFEFAHKYKLLNKNHLTQILTLQKDKHELELKAFYSCIAEFGTFLDEKGTKQFFKELTTLPIDENMITLIKDYTLNVVDKNDHFRRHYMEAETGFGVVFLWGLIISDVDFSIGLRYKIIQCFAALLSNIAFAKEVEKFVILAIKAIENRKNIDSYLRVIHQTLKLCKGPRIAKAIEVAERQINIIESVINSLKENKAYSDHVYQSAFEFLEEVSYARKNSINFTHIRELWKIKPCRIYLLKFMRKFRFKGSEEKSQQKIINKQLDKQTIKDVIDKIFLDAGQMDGYELINQEYYQTADQLIIAYNHKIESIDYNYKHTIRVKNYQKIIGTEFYLSLINSTKNKELLEKAIKRYVQFFLRTDSTKESQKINQWTQIVHKLSNFKYHTLLGYKIFLQEIKGRMKSLNILNPDPVSVLVLNMQTKEKKSISPPRCTSLWKLRHIIGEEFNLKQLNFEMQLSSNFTKTDFQKEEDFSMALISNTKDGQPSVLIVPSKQRHPHLESIESFLKIFAEMKGDELLEKLGEPECEAATLDLLEKIPFVKKLHSKIVKIDFKEMNELLDSSCMAKLSYQIKIFGSDKSLKLSSYAEKGFIPHILKIFINKKNYLRYDVLIQLMKLFTEIVKAAKGARNFKDITFDEALLNDILHSPSIESPDYISFMTQYFIFLRELLGAFPKTKASILFSHKNINSIIELILFNAKERMAENLFEICRLTSSMEYLTQIINKFLSVNFLQKYQYSCKNLFDLIVILIERRQYPAIIENIKTFLKKMRHSDLYEKSEERINQLMLGYIQLLLSCVRSTKKIEDFLDENVQSFVNYLVSPCLFNLANPKIVRFKSGVLREYGFALLQHFEVESKVTHKLSSILKEIMVDGAWRKQDEWAITPIRVVNKKFTGLKNLAATCYINSLLQQLLFIENFSNQIMELDASKIDDKENIVLEIQNIFGHLKFTENPFCTTASLCKTFILDGQPIDPRIQTDVDEFFHSLMDKLERNLEKIQKKDIINEIFGGEFSNLMIGKDCQHTSQRIEHFLSIRLEIKGKQDLDQALKEFIKAEILEGENAYFCERCDKKVRAEKRVCLKTLPEVLIVTLKRFEFDYDTMEKFKLNTFCSFPETMNFLPYTKDGIENDHEVDQNDYVYRLKGVIIHYGISEAGHYTSYVRTDSETWNYFDDQKIYDFDSKNLEAECFGGIEENPFGDDEEKKKNAYLLFYEKIKKPRVRELKINLSKTALYQQIEAQNIRNKFVNVLFEANLQNYLFNTADTDQGTFLIYYHLVFLRNAQKKQKHELFYNRCKDILKSKNVATWYLSQINEAFVEEFLIYAELEVRYLVTSLVIDALPYANPDPSLLQHLTFFINRKGIFPMIRIFSEACKTNKIYQKYLGQINFGDIVLNIIRNKQVKPKFFQELKVRREPNVFGTPTCSYNEKPYFDAMELLQAVEGLKINIGLDQITVFLKRIKKLKTIRSLAMAVVKKFGDYEAFLNFSENFLKVNLITAEFGIAEENQFLFYIYLVEYFSKIVDANAPKRIKRLVEYYIVALRQSLQGYKAEQMLLVGLFRICYQNVQFRDCIAEEFNNQKESKKVLKSIKEWIKETVNLSYQIRTSKWQYFRRAKQNISYAYLTDAIEREEKLPIEKYQSALNSISQKHASSLRENDEVSVDEMIKYNDSYKVVKKIGLLCEIISDEGKSRIVPIEEITRLDF